MLAKQVAKSGMQRKTAAAEKFCSIWHAKHDKTRLATIETQMPALSIKIRVTAAATPQCSGSYQLQPTDPHHIHAPPNTATAEVNTFCTCPCPGHPTGGALYHNSPPESHSHNLQLLLELSRTGDDDTLCAGHHQSLSNVHCSVPPAVSS
jgi:hypothetical protein